MFRLEIAVRSAFREVIPVELPRESDPARARSLEMKEQCTLEKLAGCGSYTQTRCVLRRTNGELDPFMPCPAPTQSAAG